MTDKEKLAKLYVKDLSYEIIANIQSGDHTVEDMLNYIDNTNSEMVDLEEYEICIQLMRLKKWLKKTYDVN